MIVVFDAQCLLCSRSVRFLLRFDRRAVLRFASIQGAAGRSLLARAGLPADGVETFLLVDGDRVWQQTAAVFRVLHALGWPWRAAWLLWIVPGPVRDAAYRWVARNRTRLSGRSDHCLIPGPEHAARFLD